MYVELEPCRSPWWANGGHAQTILGHLIPSPRLQGNAEVVHVPLGDGDLLSVLHYIPEAQASASAPLSTDPTIVYLFHGLGGSAGADYMHRTAQVCLDLGAEVYLANHRGCGEGAGLAMHPYHSGRGEDLSAVIAMGRKRHPSARHIAIGFSLSGNALLVLLQGKRGNTLPDYAISVNAPIHLGKASRMISSGLNRVYDLRFVRLLRAELRTRQKFGLLEHTYGVPPWATLHGFDDLYTAPAGGFRDREHYYESCSTYRDLAAIRTPLMLLTAADDPFICVEDYRDARVGERTQLHIEREGGHMGYLSARPTELGTRRWLDYAIRETMRSFCCS